MKKYSKIHHIKISKVTVPLGILLGLFLTWGYLLERDGQIDFTKPSLYFITILCGTAGILLLNLLWALLDRHQAAVPKSPRLLFPCRGWHWLAIFLILLACYLVTFLAVYPGFFTYDATMAYLELANKRINNQHPLIYILILGKACVYSLERFGQANTGIALYIGTQMVFVTGAFTYALYEVKKKTHNAFFTLLALVYYALFPTIHMFAVSSAKDTTFTTCFLILLLLLYDMFLDEKDFFRNPVKCACFVIFTAGFLIMRSNALYAFVLFIPIFLSALRKKWWKGAILLFGIFLLLGIYFGPFTNRYPVGDIGSREKLSVPSQQMARVYNERIDLLTVEEIEQLETFYNKEYLSWYLPKLADHVKNNLNEYQYSTNKAAYYKLWLSIGLKAPSEYVNAFLMTTYGYWYPWASLDGYRGYLGMEGTILEDAENYYFGYVTEEPGERHSFIPVLDRFYFWLSTVNLHHRWPVLSLLFSPGAMFWVYLIAGAYYMHTHKKVWEIPFILIGLIWLTIQLGPISLVRYVLILFFGLPFILSIYWQNISIRKSGASACRAVSYFKR